MFGARSRSRPPRLICRGAVTTHSPGLHSAKKRVLSPVRRPGALHDQTRRLRGMSQSPIVSQVDRAPSPSVAISCRSLPAGRRRSCRGRSMFRWDAAPRCRQAPYPRGPPPCPPQAVEGVASLSELRGQPAGPSVRIEHDAVHGACPPACRYVHVLESMLAQMARRAVSVLAGRVPLIELGG
jgi:hypothetical protein